MRTLLLGLAAVFTLASLPMDTSEAHGRGHGASHVSIGVGFGYPAYRPYRYYPSYYGGYGYSSRSYLGFGVWPRYRPRAARTETNRFAALPPGSAALLQTHGSLR
jgi:hypothetical protein